jgi:hypothetical protein
VRHVRTNKFRKAFENLPPEVKDQARKAFELFCRDRSHPSLAIEQLGGYPGVWSGRISQKYRWTFHFEKDLDTGELICVHRVIGSHDDVYSNP